MGASGTIAQSYAYDSFGNTTASTGSLRNDLQYTARELDTETNLYYYRARYYDSGVGRFISEDPKRFDGGVDFYRYASNNPINVVDPLGLMPCWTKPLTITRVVSCSTEFVSSKGFSCKFGDPKGQVQSLCDQIRKGIQQNGSFDLPPVPCPSGQCCKNMQMQNHFEPVNEEFTITQKGCTVTFKLTGVFEGKGEIGTCSK